MKARILIFLSVTFAMVACNQNKHVPSKEGEYRSVIRLWEAHHLSDTLEQKLVSAFKKYPKACDEVWFFTNDPADLDPAEKQQRADKLVKAAEDMRSLGIIPSLQTINLGHPNGVTTESDFNKFGFRAMTSIDGVHAFTQNCPRDTMFQNELARQHAYYAEKYHPDGIYLDDDLRITSHAPAKEMCFCDHCIDEFNAQFSYSFSREQLKKALNDNVPGVRRNWIGFSQESLALVARAVSRAVHKVSPETHMGLQHVNFHRYMMEGWDWNRIFNAMEEETGNVPYSRPGDGYYNDHAPREMIVKAYGLSRQISRLNKNINMIAPEIEGYYHRATGKSPQSLCTETLLYLGMGATSMSYAIICSNSEPLEWYADNYFKYLDRYHDLFKSYTAFNKGTDGAGIGSYISPDHAYRNVLPEEDPDAWKKTDAGNSIYALAPLGIPFTPEAAATTATMLDAEAVKGMTAANVAELFGSTGVVMDKAALAMMQRLFPEFELKPIDNPSGLNRVECRLTAAGGRVAVLPKFSADLNNADRMDMIRVFDWASKGQMKVMLESAAQVVLAPRTSQSDGSLRSVVLVNATITDLESVKLRLRSCPEGARISWESVGKRSERLKAEKDGDDLIVTVRNVKAWDAGWIKVSGVR